MSALNVGHLRPLGMGQIIDRAIRLYRRNFARFLGVAALIQIPTTLISIVLTAFSGSAMLNASSGDELGLAAGVLVFIGGILAAVWSQIGLALLLQIGADTYLELPTGIRAAFSKIGHSWLTLIGTLLLLALLLIVMIVVFIIPCVGWLLAIPGVGLLGFGSLVIVSLIAPIVVLERQGGRAAIRRAWEMARQRFWWLIGFFILLTLFAALVVQGPLYMTLGIMGAAAGDMMGQNTLYIVQFVISALFGVIFLPIQATCIMLVYFDLRVRQEGLDLALQAVDDEKAVATVLQQVPPLPETRLFTGTEIGYFCLISLIAGALLFLFTLVMGVAIAPLLNF